MYLKITIFLAIYILLSQSIAAQETINPPEFPSATVDQGQSKNGPVDAKSKVGGDTAKIPQGEKVTGTATGLEASAADKHTSGDNKVDMTNTKNSKTEGGKGSADSAATATVKPTRSASAPPAASSTAGAEVKLRNVKNFNHEGALTTGDSAENVEVGGIRADNVGRFQINSDTGQITFSQAERIELPDGILTQVRSFVGHEIEFHVGQAQDVLLGCIAMRQVQDTDYKINDRNIEITPAPGVEFNIADCGFAQNHFKAHSEDSKLIISKSKRANYKIEKGELNCHSIKATETIQANSSAEIQYGSSCFSCLTLDPLSTYWYNSEELEKDFGIHVPVWGEQFKLCLKKQPLDYFTLFDGMVDFVDKKISLTKFIEYLKYPYRNNEIAGILMNKLHEDKDDFRIQMQLDDAFIFIDEILISSNVKENESGTITKTITNPGNFYELQEKLLQDEIHRLVKINFRMPKEGVTQERIKAYKTNYFEPELTILDNVAEQKNRPNSVTILPPEHERINGILAPVSIS